MQQKALAHNVIIILVALIITFLVMLGVGGVISGKTNSAGDSAVNIFKDMFSMCDNLGTKDIAGFIDAMNDAYLNCKNGDCACKKITTNFGADGNYHIFDAAMIADELPAFNKLNGPEVYCEQDDSYWGSEIDAYYSGDFTREKNFWWPSNDVISSIKTKQNPITEICSPKAGFIGGDPMFKVPHGATVKIKAINGNSLGNIIETTLLGTVVNLKVTIEGGTYVNSLTPPPGGCIGDSDCDKTLWGWCDNSNCKYRYYCANRPSNTPKCPTIQPITINCPENKEDATRRSTTTPTPCTNGAAKAFTCANGFKAEVLNLRQPYLDGTPTPNTNIEVKVSKGDLSGNFFILEGEETFFKESGGNIEMGGTGVFAETFMDTASKMSVIFKDKADLGSGNYALKIYQGCY